MPEGPAPAPVIQRLRVRYAKRGRLRFTSHRDISRAVERAVRRAGIPVAFSAGFTPHPKISYAGAAATGVASEAEYLEIGLTEPRDPARVRAELDAALPPGLDIVDVVALPAGTGKSSALADRLQASEWRVRLGGVAEGDAAAAVSGFLDAGAVEVERLTKKGRRRFDVRAAVSALELAPDDRRGTGATDAPCAILRMVVRHTTPAVRPDDILTGLRQVADLAPPSPPLVTRLAQGPLDERTGELADPLDPDRETAAAAGDDAGRADGPALPRSGDAVGVDAVSARS
ncbi:TIGR03936 family radical SAM-associated protein [Actinomadura rupiterrae]|uniref:TIGR03936 family radical SAM-associated protein n=1 Tax=Actinomadura rupiterrae TaxID=559627 RepID=UPI0020A328FE|nr:TIGR03936 family radical SAM-associated protein [Actinomadura rupiterrae]MCP2343773.1 radical SAM-linked protein [Actinomadura rupiterrae]